MEARLNKTELNDRTLWYDGDSTVDYQTLKRLLAAGKPTDRLFVDQLTQDIKQFNKTVRKEQQITVKQSVDPVSIDWNLPQQYKDIDLWEWLIDTLYQQFDQDDPLNNQDIHKYAARCAHEYGLYQKHQLFDVLRALIYIINTFEENNIVWGVGRGSSVSSYILYLIGVHDVDSVKYQLDIHDFLT